MDGPLIAVILFLLIMGGLVWAFIGFMKHVTGDDCKHDWSKWTPKPYGYQTVNVRVCKACGKVSTGSVHCVRFEDAKEMSKLNDENY